MAKKILVISGSPKKDGNTASLVAWFSEGARQQDAEVEIVLAASLRFRAAGCTSCRACQKSPAYECVIDDDAKPVLKKMAQAEVIVMATPLYFFSMSAQLKVLIDRMFSLYKWDNAANTVETPLKGKMLVLLASAYEDVGLDALEKPFALTAAYTGMGFESLLVPHAGVSGEIAKKPDVAAQARALGARTAAAS